MDNHHDGQYRAHKRSNQETMSFEPIRHKPAAAGNGVSRNAAQRTGKPPKSRGTMSPFVKTFAYVICVFAASVILATFAILVGNDMLGLLKPSADVTIEIPADVKLGQLATLLKENDVIQYKSMFQLFASLSKKSLDYKGKAYLFNTDMGYTEVFTTLRQISAKKDTVKVTIPEGKEQREIAAILEEKKVCTAQAFMDACNKETYHYSFLEGLPDRESRLEGYLFPDTYEFYVEDDPKVVVKKFLSNFQSKFTEAMMTQTKVTGYSIDQVITLASIIEREAGNDSERATVSSVFWNRLNSKTYPYLQSCATVQYILEERKGILSRADTEIDNPYNTYLHKGLPIGPIASPGVASMKAALKPKSTDYYFFVVNSDGQHLFSRTYEEHLKAIKDARSSQGTGAITE